MVLLTASRVIREIRACTIHWHLSLLASPVDLADSIAWNAAVFFDSVDGFWGGYVNQDMEE